MKDLYEMLELKKGASADEIKRSYRRLAAKYHPDVNKEKGAEEKFKEIQNAYEVLSDPQKKSQYDQFGSTGGPFGGGGGNGAGFEGFQGFGGGGFGFEDFGDIFESFFGGGTQRKRGPQKGRDIQVGISLTFLESISGVQKDISLQSYVECATCSGKCVAEGSHFVQCPTCSGAGQITRVQQTPLGNIRTTTTCPQCQGEGRIPEKPCPNCKGNGRVQEKRTLKVSIPAGVYDGALLRLSGKGEAGERGATPGDLLVQVAVTPSRDFQREGDDILSTVHIHVLQAVLGDEILVKTVQGEERIKIPAGTQSSRIFRLRGKGSPKLGKGSSGDHLVTIVVDIPEKLTSKERELYENLAREVKVQSKEKGFFSGLFE